MPVAFTQVTKVNFSHEWLGPTGVGSGLNALFELFSMVGLVLLDNLWQVWYSHKFELGSSPLLSSPLSLVSVFVPVPAFQVLSHVLSLCPTALSRAASSGVCAFATVRQSYKQKQHWTGCVCCCPVSLFSRRRIAGSFLVVAPFAVFSSAALRSRVRGKLVKSNVDTVFSLLYADCKSWLVLPSWFPSFCQPARSSVWNIQGFYKTTLMPLAIFYCSRCFDGLFLRCCLFCSSIVYSQCLLGMKHTTLVKQASC